MAGFCVNSKQLPGNTVFCFSLSQTAESKLRTPRPMRLCVLGLGDDMMSSIARWSLKRLVFSAIISCPAQEYDTPSTTNDEGDHCENRAGAARTILHCLWSIREKGQKPTVPTHRKPCWEFGPAMSPSGNTRPREHDVSPKPRFIASCHLHSLAKNRKKML